MKADLFARTRFTAAVAFLGALALAVTATAGTTQFQDGVFDDADWTISILTAGAGGTGSAAQQIAGGNPDEYRAHTIDVLPETAVAIVAVRNDSNYDPGVTGAIGEIDYSEDARFTTGSGPGMFSWPLVVQGGVNYVATGLAVPEMVWTGKALNDLGAADFGRLDANLVVIFDDNPDFSPAGDPMQFGYVRMYASEGSETLVADIDNWSITVDSVAPIGSCGLGAVNVGCGPRADILAMNGSFGGPAREIVVTQSTALSGTIIEPPLHIGDGRDTKCVVYAWVGEPLGSDVVTLPKSLGSMCYGPFISATKAPNTIWNSLGIVPKLGADNGPGPVPLIIDAQPFEFLSLTNGLGQAATVTFQGIVADNCTQGTVNFSVTNGFVLRIQ